MGFEARDRFILGAERTSAQCWDILSRRPAIATISEGATMIAGSGAASGAGSVIANHFW
jgi:hypothetical protein